MQPQINGMYSMPVAHMRTLLLTLYMKTDLPAYLIAFSIKRACMVCVTLTRADAWARCGLGGTVYYRANAAAHRSASDVILNGVAPCISAADKPFAPIQSCRPCFGSVFAPSSRFGRRPYVGSHFAYSLNVSPPL